MLRNIIKPGIVPQTKEVKMKTLRSRLSLAAAMIALAAIMAPQMVMAATAPCTEITNQANLAYKVGNVTQPVVLSDKDTDDTTIEATKFNVGIKVLVTVTSQDAGSNVGVVPSDSLAKLLTYKITNSGNAIHDYALTRIPGVDDTPSHTATVDTWDLRVGTEDSVTSTIKVWRENGLDAATGLQTIGGTADTDITATLKIEDLDPAMTYALTDSTNEATAGTRTIYIEYLPAGLNAKKDTVTVDYLKAVTKWADNSDLPVFTAGNASMAPTLLQAGGDCDGTITVDIVAGDDEGDGGSALNNLDIERDGIDVDWAAFVVQNAVIDHTKTFYVVEDGLADYAVVCSSPQATNLCKPIPGAVVQYSLELENTGNASATLGNITDDLDSNFTIVAAGATWTVSGSDRGVATVSGALTADGDNTDGLSFAPSTLTAAMATILAADASGSGHTAGELKVGETVTITFKATIN